MSEASASTPYRSTNRRVTPATRRHERHLVETRELLTDLGCVVVDELDFGPRTTVVRSR